MPVESNEDLYARRHREKTEHLPITRGQLMKLSQFVPRFEFQTCKVLCDGLIEFEGRLATGRALGQKVYVYLDDEGRMLANVSMDRMEEVPDQKHLRPSNRGRVAIWKARKFFNWADPWKNGKPENVEEIESEFDFSLTGGLVPDIRQWCIKQITGHCPDCGSPWTAESGATREDLCARCKTEIDARLEELRAALQAENISMSELIDLQGLAEHIQPWDLELLEAAGVPEFPEEDESCSTDAQ